MFVAELDSLNNAVAIAALVLTIVVVLHRWNKIRARRNSLPYPPQAPVSVWETVQGLSGDDNPWFYWRTSQKMGASIFRLPPLPVWGAPMMVVVGDHKTAREILTDKETTKPRDLYGLIDGTTNGVQSLFTSNGSYWHARRKGIAPAFSSNHVHRMNTLALAKTDKWIEERLRPLIEEGKSFDVGDEMIDLLLVAIADTAFQYTISPNEVKLFKEELEIVLRELFKANFNPLRRYCRCLLPGQRRAKLAAKRLQGLSLNMIRAYRRLSNPVRGTIIDLICSNPCYKDDEERSADVTVLLLAGHDTTAYSLAWTLKELALHPEIQAELRASILSAETGQAPNQLDSVRKVIREAIRLHPVSATGSARRVGRDFVTADGKLIPAGSITTFPFLSILRDPAVFGKDSEEFNPSRWDDANVTTEMNQAFLPFSAGRQNCVGQPLANAELHCILPRIISQFELSIEKEGTHAWFLTLKPSGTMLKAQPVNQA